MSADKCSSLRRLYENILIDSLFSWNQVWISDCNQTLDSFSCDISHAIYKTMWHRYSIVSHFHQRVIWIDAYFFSGTGLGSTDELSQSAARVFCFTATAFDLYWLSSNNCGEEFNPRVAARSFCYSWFQTFLCLSLRPSGTSLHFHRAFCKEIIFFFLQFYWLIWLWKIFICCSRLSIYSWERVWEHSWNHVVQIQALSVCGNISSTQVLNAVARSRERNKQMWIWVWTSLFHWSTSSLKSPHQLRNVHYINHD